MVLQHSNYRAFLRATLADRQKKNGAYSMRAYAKHLGVTQSAVSQILSGKKNLSAETALKMAGRLELAELEAEYFCLLTQLETAKTPALKETVIKRLNSLNPQKPIHELSLEFFRVISDWYHLAIRNMTEMDGVILSPKFISRRLGISVIQAEVALERLCSLELIEKVPHSEHQYKKTADYVIAKSAAPNEALRNFHRQMLQKAQEALVAQTPAEKIVGSETFAFSEKHLKEANQITEEYFQRMAALAQKPGKKNEVYHLGVQFFNLTKEKK